jgi:hypothetical protein
VTKGSCDKRTLASGLVVVTDEILEQGSRLCELCLDLLVRQFSEFHASKH